MPAKLAHYITVTLNPAGSWTSLIPLLDSSPGILVPPISGKSGGGEVESRDMKREESTQQAVRKMRHPQFDVCVTIVS